MPFNYPNYIYTITPITLYTYTMPPIALIPIWHWFLHFSLLFTFSFPSFLFTASTSTAILSFLITTITSAATW